MSPEPVQQAESQALPGLEPALPATASSPAEQPARCELLVWHADRVSRARRRGGEVADHSDGWERCPAAGRHVDVARHRRVVCGEHRLQIAGMAAVLIGRLRWADPAGWWR